MLSRLFVRPCKVCRTDQVENSTSMWQIYLTNWDLFLFRYIMQIKDGAQIKLRHLTFRVTRLFSLKE